jgi:hypothetical protein
MQGSASCVYLHSMVKQKVRHRHFILFNRRLKVLGTFGDVQGNIIWFIKMQVFWWPNVVYIAKCGIVILIIDSTIVSTIYFWNCKNHKKPPHYLLPNAIRRLLKSQHTIGQGGYVDCVVLIQITLPLM